MIPLKILDPWNIAGNLSFLILCAETKQNKNKFLEKKIPDVEAIW